MIQDNIPGKLNKWLVVLAAFCLILIQVVPAWASDPPTSTPLSDRILVLQLQDVSISVGINDQGRIIDTLAGGMSDDSFSLSIAAGTQVLISDVSGLNLNPQSQIGNNIPQKIAVDFPDSLPALPEGWMQVSRAYDVYALSDGRKTGVRMDKGALLSIQYDAKALPETLDGLATFSYDKQLGWTQVPAPDGFIAEAGRSAAVTDHFSLFVVLAKTGKPVKLPADIMIQKISVNPPRITVGQSSEVRVKVTNNGGLPGEYIVVLKMNGKVQKTQTVQLDPGQNTEIDLIITPAQNGLYSLTAGSAQGQLMVEPDFVPDVVETNYWWLLFVALGLSTLLFSLLHRKRLSRRKEEHK